MHRRPLLAPALAASLCLLPATPVPAADEPPPAAATPIADKPGPATQALESRSPARPPLISTDPGIPPPAEPGGYAEREDVARILDALSRRHGFRVEQAAALVAQARYQPRVVQLILPTPGGLKKNWAAYRARFVEPIRIQSGVKFWAQHAALLDQAEARYGVPPAIVMGILGVETGWGADTGTFRVLDALATLAFDFPTSSRRDRSSYFRDELGEFIDLCLKQGLDPTSLRGSFAGAMGLPQFMPSSLRKLAVDFDGDGRIDLQGSVADAIGSVAAYLHAFGWEPRLPTHFHIEPPSDAADLSTLLAPDIVPSFAASEMAERGARLPEDAMKRPGLLALVKLENGDAPATLLAGTANFYAITRYNWSSYYAMAVIELGQAVEAARRAPSPAARKPANRPASKPARKAGGG